MSCTPDVVSCAPKAVFGTPDVVSRTDVALTHHVDALLGRATDGGWWALGLRDPAHADVLTDVPMSTSETSEHTSLALQARGVHVADLPSLSDVDTMADARRIAPGIPDSRFAGVLDDLLAVPVAPNDNGRGT